MAVFTLCFCGTSCWPDEGIVDHPETSSQAAFYGDVGYIPVAVHRDIVTSEAHGKAVIPGPGPPWRALSSTLWVPSTQGNISGKRDEIVGNSMWDLAGHGAAVVAGLASTGRGRQSTIPGGRDNEIVKAMRRQLGIDIAPTRARKPPTNECYQYVQPPFWWFKTMDGGEPITTVNIIGHSRGGVAAIMCAHELYYVVPEAKVNIFAIDPVPGTGSCTREITRLAPNVDHYVGVYAVDETSTGFNGVVPWPYNGGNPIDPLRPTTVRRDIKKYHLIYAPGRHATVAGNKAKDGAADLTPDCTPMLRVNQLVNTLARACLARWGTVVDAAPLGNPTLTQLKAAMTANAAAYRGMRKHKYVGDWMSHWEERGISSADGMDASDWHYLEDAIGIAPLVARVDGWIPTLLARPDPGVIRWQAIQDVPNRAFTHGEWISDR
jgi:hypothetical protein